MSSLEVLVPGVVTFAAADALAGEQDAREQVREQVERTVQQSVEQAVRGAQAGEHAQKLEEELAKARQAVDELQATPSGGTVSITKDGNGNVVIRTADGKTIVVNEGLIPPGALDFQAMVGSAAPPPMPFDQGPPEGVLALIGIIFGCITVMVVGWPLARAFGRRVEARAAAPGVPADVAVRLERIEHAVDAVAVEMERVSEAQRYSARLLTERLPESVPQLAGAERAARATADRA